MARHRRWSLLCATVLTMSIPAFASTGMLPLGRHSCDLSEFEAVFVTASRFRGSSSRVELFADFLSAVQFLREEFSDELVECVWIGGGFTTAKIDPTDIDVTFILNWSAYDSLSNSKRGKLSKLLRAGGFKRLALSVDGFMMVRERVAQPWAGAGLGSDGADYFPLRGAWDDWWSRDRAHTTSDSPPVIEDADPVRGYVEVMI